MNVKDLSGLDFAALVKDVCKRLQDEAKPHEIIEVENDGYRCSTIIIPNIDNDFAEPFHINDFYRRQGDKRLIVKSDYFNEIDKTIK